MTHREEGHPEPVRIRLVQLEPSSGTATPPSVRAAITRNCVEKSASRNNRCLVGWTRTTCRRSTTSPSSLHRVRQRMVSLEKPLAAGASTSKTSGSAPRWQPGGEPGGKRRRRPAGISFIDVGHRQRLCRGHRPATAGALSGRRVATIGDRSGTRSIFGAYELGGAMAVRGYEHLFIGGDRVTPAGTGTIEVISPTPRRSSPRSPTPPRPTSNVRLPPPAGVRQGPWPRMTPVERADILAKVSEAITAEMGEMAETSPPRWAPRSRGPVAQVPAPSMIFNYYVGLAGSFAFESPAGPHRPQVLVRKEPVGVVAAIVPWNVPLFVASEAGPGPGGRLHDGVQAGAGDPARRLPAGRAARRGRPARGRASTSSRPAARWASTWSPTPTSTRSPSPAGRRPAADRRPVRRAAQALQPRARRQVGGHHPRRRRPRRRHPDACCPTPS